MEQLTVDMWLRTCSELRTVFFKKVKIERYCDYILETEQNTKQLFSFCKQTNVNISNSMVNTKARAEADSPANIAEISSGYFYSVFKLIDNMFFTSIPSFQP